MGSSKRNNLGKYYLVLRAGCHPPRPLLLEKTFIFVCTVIYYSINQIQISDSSGKHGRQRPLEAGAATAVNHFVSHRRRSAAAWAVPAQLRRRHRLHTALFSESIWW